MVITVVVMMLIVFGLPVAVGLLLRPKTGIGGRSSFSRWWSANRDRTEAAKEIARRYDMRYAGDSIEGDRIAHFFYFTHKNPGALWDLVAGESEAMREALFSNRQSRSEPCTLAQFTSPSLKLPVFRIGARDFLFRDRTVPEISFGDVPEFSAAFEVRGENEAEVRALLDRGVRAALAGAGSLWIEGKPFELLCVSSVDYTLLREREEFLRLARKICSILAARGNREA